jgi:hypothetical protein
LGSSVSFPKRLSPFRGGYQAVVSGLIVQASQPLRVQGNMPRSRLVCIRESFAPWDMWRVQDTLACISAASLPSQPVARPARRDHSTFCASSLLPSCRGASTSDSCFKTSRSVHHVASRCGVTMPQHGVRSSIQQQAEGVTPGSMFWGVSSGPPCECRTCRPHIPAVCVCTGNSASVLRLRAYAVPAQAPAPAPASIDKQPLIPYDSDEQSAGGPGLAPFIPPPIQKLISIIMRHGKKDQAQGIVFDASHALYNAARRPNPRPELRQRQKEFVPK